MKEKSGVTVKRINIFEGETPTKAFCDISISDIFTIRGLRIIQGKNGLFLSMPREKGKDGKWYDIFYANSREIHKEIEERVLGYYAEKRKSR